MATVKKILCSVKLKLLIGLIWLSMAFALLVGKAPKQKLRTRLFFFAPFLYPRMCHSFWDKVSNTYRDKALYSPQHLIARGILKSIMETIRFENVLEIGCGTGENLIFLKGLYPDASFVGCDFSEEQIEKARCYPGIQYDVADCRHLPYADKSFDVVITVGCLSHIPLKHMKQCASEIQRVAKYGLIILEEDYRFASPDIMLTQKLLGWHFYHDYMRLFGDFAVSYLGNNMPSQKLGLHTHLYVRKSQQLAVMGSGG